MSIRRKEPTALLAECPAVEVAEHSARWGIKRPLDVPWVRHDRYDVNGALGGGYEALCRCTSDMPTARFIDRMDFPPVRARVPQRIRMEPHEKQASIMYVGQCSECGTVHWGVYFK